MTVTNGIVDLGALPIGEHRLRCPQCGRDTPVDRTLGVKVDPDGWVAHCFRCEHVESQRADVLQPRVRPSQPQHLPARKIAHAVLSDHACRLWQSTRAIDSFGTAAQYLAARGCAPVPVASHLRWTPMLAHPSGYCGPGLVACITDTVTREPISLHRTWIKPDGTKPDITPQRMLLKNHRKAGGVIRITCDEHVGGVLGVAEGIESALSLLHACEAVWCCIDAGNLGSFPVLPGIEHLFIAADGDAAGRRASDTLAERYAQAGRWPRVIASPEGFDINDSHQAGDQE